jgi:hypothetical protein
MRAFSLWAAGAAAVATAALALAAASCGDKVQTGLTGVDIQITFESDLPIEHLRFAGFLGGDQAFPSDDRPHAGDDRDLDPGDENLIVILPDTMAGQSVFVRVDGLDESGAILASAGGTQELARGQILGLRLHLGQPRACGDGMKHATAELCDDGNQLDGDGCSDDCVVETGWTCDGTPSVCQTCGDGVCSVGEDHCSCREDCEGIATCGDGSCCPARDENVCSCPEDCLEEGAVTCPDSYCCPEEREAGNCEPDCGMCGDGTCEPDKGEDLCTCAEDCSAGPPVCGNQVCCDSENSDTCPQDCCPDVPTVDGVCCPVESAANAPEDCCPTMAQCGDTTCCPGENPMACPECCPSDACGDDICCGGETIDSCPNDCCPSCSLGGGMCSGCCADQCASGACDFSCSGGCSCHFDCTPDKQCDVTCTSSSCQVECGSQPCNVSCQLGATLPDGGVLVDTFPGGAGICYCHGSGCNLTCPPGSPQVECADGGVACGVCP